MPVTTTRLDGSAPGPETGEAAAATEPRRAAAPLPLPLLPLPLLLPGG